MFCEKSLAKFQSRLVRKKLDWDCPTRANDEQGLQFAFNLLEHLDEK